MNLLIFLLAGCKNNSEIPNLKNGDSHDSHNHEHSENNDHSHDEHDHQSGIETDNPESKSDEHVHAKDDSDVGHDENIKLLLTSYSENFEVYAELDPLYPGKSSELLIHVTQLSDFKPLEEGNISLKLSLNGKSFKLSVSGTRQKGIYVSEILPEGQGKGKLEFEIDRGDGISEILSSAIEVFANEHEAIHDSENKMHTAENAISFSKEQSWKIGFATSSPAEGPFGSLIKSVAIVRASPENDRILTAKTNGSVLFSDKTMVEGAKVQKGEILFSISGTGLAEKSPEVRYNEARINFMEAESQYNRKKALVEEKIVSEKEFLEAKAIYENAKMLYENLQNNFSAGVQNLISPEDGFIRELFIENGQYVEAGEALLRITSNDKLLLHGEVKTKYFKELQKIEDVIIHSMENNVYYKLKDLNGRILSIGQSVSGENFMIPLDILIESREDFIIGSFVEIIIKTQSDLSGIIIPASSILEEQGNYFVLVQKTPELFERRQIQTGGTDGIQTHVISGLKPEERIITKGAVMVKLAAGTGALDPHAGHVH